MDNELIHILLGPADIVAQRLLGCLLVREIDGELVVGRIVETEAYDQTDAASHSYRGQTERTKVMFGPPGRLYVYFAYGMHYCCNVVTGPSGQGAAVLIRAVEPVEGEQAMSERRHGLHGEQLTNGPAKFCQAFGIDKHLNGHDLREMPLQLVMQPALNDEDVCRTTRIGIKQAQSIPWRFYDRTSKYVAHL